MKKKKKKRKKGRQKRSLDISDMLRLGILKVGRVEIEQDVNHEEPVNNRFEKPHRIGAVLVDIKAQAEGNHDDIVDECHRGQHVP